MTRVESCPRTGLLDVNGAVISDRRYSDFFIFSESSVKTGEVFDAVNNFISRGRQEH